ncbi:hypothetical protein ACFQL7_09620 [Halocatena marina]|uniref:Uncharacterized protein n=1 Tax=Halocatena marina TaxID=2934937 RepID=A0ABD5YMC5_9EURY
MLEYAGTGDETVKTLIRELESVAVSGVGLIFQGTAVISELRGAASGRSIAYR